jgi:hypothetical protein
MCNRPDEANMICYDCSRDSVNKDAVGICNRCSSGICRKHAVEGRQTRKRNARDKPERDAFDTGPHTLVSAV